MTSSPIIDCHLHVLAGEYPYPDGPGVKPNPGEIVGTPDALHKTLSANG